MPPEDPAATLAKPLTLPCGAVLPNRLAKSAMAEALGDGRGAPTEALVTLYERWAAGGAGLLVTGNVMVDATRLGEDTDVVLVDDRHLPLLRRWAEAGTRGGGHLWMQLNHPGRQSASPDPVAPSAVALNVGRGLFKTPRALEAHEIEGIVAAFGRAAGLAREAGFTGVQVHGAHGYLVSQFLSPRTNQRTDGWGGELAGRMRFLLAVVAAIREAVGKDFPVGVKLNSADFQRGGFDEADSRQVVAALSAVGVDLLEVSGGTYEKAAMTGIAQKESTREREAYFLDYARETRASATVPLMLTGGFRSVEAMAGAIAEGAIDVCGLARPLAQEPDLPARLLAGAATRSQVAPRRTGVRELDGLLEILWYQQQIQRMGRGRDPDPNRNPWLVLLTKAVDVGFAKLRG